MKHAPDCPACERDRLRKENDLLRSLLRGEGFSDKDIERMLLLASKRARPLYPGPSSVTPDSRGPAG